MAILDLRLRSYGVWKYVCSFDAERLDEVKAACLALVRATGTRGDLAFKVYGPTTGQTVALLDTRRPSVGWTDR